MIEPPVNPNGVRPERRFVPALDGVRGLAILLVLVHHAGVLEAGWVGVDLFFVLSGFLITGILLDAKDTPRRAYTFYARRTLRIVPLYYVYLFFILVVNGRRFGTVVPHSWSYWIWLSNWRVAFDGTFDRTPGVLGHLWSLAVEEQFYVLWPLVVWHVTRRWVPRICTIGIVTALLLRVALHERGVAGTSLYVMTPTRMDALLVGAWLASTPREIWIQWRTGAVIAIGLLSIAGFAQWRDEPMGATIGYSLIAATGGALVVAAMQDRSVSKALCWRPLRFAGKYSYGAYILHLYVAKVVGRSGIDSGWAYATLIVLSTFAVAWVSWHIFERPILSLKRCFPTVPATASF